MPTIKSTISRGRIFNLIGRKKNITIEANQGEGSAFWTNALELTIQVNELECFAVVTKQSWMNADFSDIRFVKNPNGTISEKIYIEHERISYTGSSALFKLARVPGFINGEVIYAIGGNSSATSKSNPYKTAFIARLITNYFNRGAQYDVSNILSNFDYLLSGPGNASQERGKHGGCQNPDDDNQCFVVCGSDEVAAHSGTSSSKIALIKSTNFGTSWSETTILDANIGYRATSTDSISIPTIHPSTRTFTIQAGLSWQIGQVGIARASTSNYFWFTVDSYVGTTLQVSSFSHTGSGTFSSWTILQQYGWTNVSITSVKMPNGTVRLGVLANRGNFDPSASADAYRVFFIYSDDLGITWSSPVQVGPDNLIYVGGNATTMDNGYMIFMAHENNANPAQYYSTAIITRDYGSTFVYARAAFGTSSALLDETDCRQLKDASTKLFTNQCRCVCRNESATTNYRQYKWTLTVTATEVTVSNIAENDWTDPVQSRYTSYRTANDTIFYVGGDSTAKMVYSTDECQTFHQVPFNVLNTAAVGARRTYGILFGKEDGRMMHVWATNKLTNGSDLYVNYFDWTLNQLYCDAANTVTNANGSHNRPQYLNPGIKIGEFRTGYRFLSTTSITVPAVGEQRTLSGPPGLNFQANDPFTASRSSTIHWQGTVVSYNSLTGEFVGQCTAAAGSGTQSDWVVNLGTGDNTGNLLSGQNYLTIPRGNTNGQVRPIKVRIKVKTYGTNTRSSGFFGVKKHETRALAVVTVSNAGGAGDTIELRWNKSGTYTGLFASLGRVAFYTVQLGDNIADVVNGLVASANEIGICPVSTNDTTTLTLMAQFGSSTFINGNPLTVAVTGTVAASSGDFANGTAIEAYNSFQNVIEVDNPNNIVRIEQANDGHTQAFTVNDGPLTYSYEWDSSQILITDGTTTRTKGPATGSGVPNFQGHGILSLSTGNANPEGLLDELTEFIIEPLVQTPASEGSIYAGNWTERSDGLGLN